MTAHHVLVVSTLKDLARRALGDLLLGCNSCYPPPRHLPTPAIRPYLPIEDRSRAPAELDYVA